MITVKRINDVLPALFLRSYVPETNILAECNTASEECELSGESLCHGLISDHSDMPFYCH